MLCSSLAIEVVTMVEFGELISAVGEFCLYQKLLRREARMLNRSETFPGTFIYLLFF